MYILYKEIKQDLCPFFTLKGLYVFFIRWWKQPTRSGSYLNPAFPLVRLMIISESSHDHLGASCSNIGRIRTKENIAVDTRLIGILPNPLGGFLIIFNHSLTPLGLTWIVFESASLNNSYGHLGASCSNIGRIRTKENIAVDTHLIGILPNPLGGFLVIFES